MAVDAVSVALSTRLACVAEVSVTSWARWLKWQSRHNPNLFLLMTVWLHTGELQFEGKKYFCCQKFDSKTAKWKYLHICEWFQAYLHLLLVSPLMCRMVSFFGCPGFIEFNKHCCSSSMGVSHVLLWQNKSRFCTARVPWNTCDSHQICVTSVSAVMVVLLLVVLLEHPLAIWCNIQLIHCHTVSFWWVHMHMCVLFALGAFSSECLWTRNRFAQLYVFCSVHVLSVACFMLLCAFCECFIAVSAERWSVCKNMQAKLYLTVCVVFCCIIC